MSKNFYEAVAGRRTYYGIGKEVSLTRDKIKEVLDHAVKYTPSAFNSQSARVALLLDKQHDKLWDLTKEALRKIVPEEHFASTEEKIDSFKAGFGTVLFFEDEAVVKSLQEQFELYKDNFPVWSQQSSGMHQFVVWTALELEGLGASLQHYNELIEEEVKKELDLPGNWKLIAQMPFGNPTFTPDEKEFSPLDGRVKVFE